MTKSAKRKKPIGGTVTARERERYETRAALRRANALEDDIQRQVRRLKGAIVRSVEALNSLRRMLNELVADDEPAPTVPTDRELAQVDA